MQCSTRNGADTAVYTDIPSIKSQRDAFLASILAQNMKKYSGKRSCPFAAPANTQRQRADDDMKALQRDVEELEARLAAARRRKAPQPKQVNAARLRAMLQACRKQAQQDASANFGFHPAMPSCGQLEYEPVVDAPVFRKMEKSVADQYDQLAQVFTDAGLNDSKTDFYDAQVVTGATQGTFVRFTTAKVAPFGLEAISGAMWNGAKKNSVLNMGAEFAIEGGDSDVMYLKRECMLQGDSSGIPVLLRGVCRRFVEPHRIVVVWEGTGDWPKDYLRSHPSSVPIRERGYCVIQTFHSGNKGGRAAPLSLFQTCVCMTPGLSAGIDMNQPECLQMLSDVVIPSYRKILEAREQMLENFILDEIIHSKMRGATSRI
ncbi:M96 mating-specific protein family [Phytophthora palmivora]|uniref:M96 mating-specific protein family n=1 Tax=Phytophthora palmivora TaxID=4796 RepID=A0A2P4Y1D4_9STRA|nr:M96 mating-specific protein family [Phytophthora palmivora]